MKAKLSLILVLLLPLCALSQEAPTFANPDDEVDGPKHLDIYLVIGQSNMAGRAEIPVAHTPPLENSFLFTGDSKNSWTKAENPFNQFSSIRKGIGMQRLSPAYAFAKTMSSGSTRSIGLVVNARGGTKIVQWLPGTKYFEEAVDRTKEAMKDGVLKGIIWHQGEGDCDSLRTQLYLGRLEVLINAFREAFDKPRLPFVAGQVSNDREHRLPFNEMIKGLPNFINHTGLVSSTGTTTFDQTHFDTKSQMLLGERYAKEMQVLLEAQEAADPALGKAKQNGELANEGFRRSYDFLQAWMKERDVSSGLIPKNLNTSKDIWNAQDAAADNYPFMVLTAALLDEEVFEEDMLDMLEAETRLTSRLGSLPDTYSFSKGTFRDDQIVLDRLIFGASEYIKDGLLPLTEWLGSSPWSERMIAILDDIWKYANTKTPFGRIPSTNVEVNGEMLQCLSRVYWMTGEKKYLDWAIRLGDYYLLGDQHPTRDQESLRLRDHGCEIVSGLCELYFTVAHVEKEKQLAYQETIHELLNRILEVGVNEHGLMYDAVNPQNGKVIKPRIADNWGYNFNGFYAVQLVDYQEEYLGAIKRALSNLHFYKNFDWENGSQDGYADAIEGALNLYNRIPNPIAHEWLDSETQVMWSMQDSSHRPNTEAYRSTGIIEGWHGDGNFARTSIMYSLWKTQGTYLKPWKSDLIWGAEPKEDGILVFLEAKSDWTGKLYFDFPRHRDILQLPADYPRINQFPEWFVANANQDYVLSTLKGELPLADSYTGNVLREGIPLVLRAGEVMVLKVQPR